MLPEPNLLVFYEILRMLAEKVQGHRANRATDE
jgi:hypothetical protein